MTELLVVLLVVLPICQGLVCLFIPKDWARYLGIASSFLSTLLLALVFYFFHLDAQGQTPSVFYPWIPEAMLNLSFHVDGLGIFFAILITGMGALVFAYAVGYMDHSDPKIGRFYCFLNIFMGAMLGAVLADNLILLFLFWELTSVMSYLLISFNTAKDEARIASRTAFLITGASGLALLIGFILIGILDGTLELSRVSELGLLSDEHPYWLLAIMVLLMTGVAAKSAQFPFHFWLPRAMAAPTPVSAYLHSATMVKLGIYLIARMFELFSESALWVPLVSALSLLTAVLGGMLALFAHHLKRILAFATVSQLGFFISFYGIGDPEGLRYDYVHIFNHALYKGSLFMLFGLVMHATGRSDIRTVAGLSKTMPWVSAVIAVSLAAMAGVPGTTGFLSKELLIQDLVILSQERALGLVVLGVLLLGLILKVAFSYRIFHFIFIAKAKEALPILHRPNRWLLLPPFILSALALFLGVWPYALERLSLVLAVKGIHSDHLQHLALWHGFTLALLLSVVALVLGLLLFRFTYRRSIDIDTIGSSGFGKVFDAAIAALPGLAGRVTAVFHRPSPTQNLYWLLGCFAISVGGILYSQPFQLRMATELNAESCVQVLLALTALGLLFVTRPMQQLLTLSLSGFLVTVYFVVRQAPDLAMTQMVVEVATLLAIILLFVKLPRKATNRPQIPRVLVATLVGLTVALIPAFNESFLSSDELSRFYLKNSQPLAKGANTVNTILVDFRGLDTLGEVCVILVAMLGVAALCGRRGALFVEHTKTLIPTPMLAATTPLLLIIALPFATYLLMRGHDSPGGGFTGGVVLALALVIAGMSSRRSRVYVLDRLNPFTLTFVGLGVALFSGVISLMIEGNFMASYFYDGVTLLSTPVLFDLGVFFIVIGVVSSVLSILRATTLKGDA